MRRLSVRRSMTLEYWIDNGWYIGRIKERPSVLSQGKSLSELTENIQDAYQLLYSSPLPQHRLHLRQVDQ